jgi:hypothetical protein
VPGPVFVGAPGARYTAGRTTAGTLELRGTDGLQVRAEVAALDPATGRRRFRGWLRAAHGPVFGVAADGRLEWISPTDAADLAELDWTRVVTVPDAALAAVELAPRPGTLVWDFRASGRVYAVGGDGRLHHVPDTGTLVARFAWREVLPLAPEQLAALPVGAPLLSTP